jgi:hypothetical protein
MNPQEKLTASELITAEALFHAHFRLNNTSRSPLQNTRTYWPWADVLDLMKEHMDIAIKGIYINYGLAEGRFIPVLEFYHERADGSLGHKPDAAYIHGHTGFNKITDTQRKALVQKYINNVLVRRTAASSTFDPLRDQIEPRDPRGIRYALIDKVHVLLGANPIVEDRSLVVSCISAACKYSDLLKMNEVDEFRHLLCLHVARPKLVEGALVMVDLLDDHDHGNFALKAMDLGNVCPPNCTSGRP